MGGGWVLEEARLRLNSAPFGLSLAGAGAELGNKSTTILSQKQKLLDTETDFLNFNILQTNFLKYFFKDKICVIVLHCFILLSQK